MDIPIPDDIREKAEAALDNMLCNCRESCGSDAALRQASIDDIARAILAERERCAMIAEWYDSDTGAHAPSIASAIRRGADPKKMA